MAAQSQDSSGTANGRSVDLDGLITFSSAIACIAAAIGLYWQRRHDFFVYDDFLFLQAVRGHSLGKVLARAFTFIEGDTLDPATPFWRPMIDGYFYAMQPFGLHSEPYHLVNFALHGIVGALAVVFFRQLCGSAFAAAAIGLLFVVAPTFDFAVTWIAQVSELAGASLVLAALLTYQAYLTNERPRRRYIALLAVITTLALSTKESTVILAALLPTLAVCLPVQQRRRSWRDASMAIAPVLVLCSVFFVAMEVHNALEDDPLHTLGWHIPRNLWGYLTWMVFPHRFGEAMVLRGAGAALFLVTGALAIALRRGSLAFAFLWTLAALLPFTAFDEWIELRYTYLATLPFVAFCVLLARELIAALPVPARHVAWAAAGAAFVAVLVVTPFRTAEQQSFLVEEAGRTQVMVNSVQSLCGDLPEGSFIYLIGAPYRDLWDIHTPAALNLYYARVNAVTVDELPGLAAFIDHKCVLRYEAASQRYVRLE